MTPIHHLGDAIRSLLLLIPLSAVRVLFVMTLAIVLIWVLRMPASRTSPEGGAKRWDENLKLGAGVALGFQILVYLWL